MAEDMDPLSDISIHAFARRVWTKDLNVESYKSPPMSNGYRPDRHSQLYTKNIRYPAYHRNGT